MATISVPLSNLKVGEGYVIKYRIHNYHYHVGEEETFHGTFIKRWMRNRRLSTNKEPYLDFNLGDGIVESIPESEIISAHTVI